MSEYIKRLEGLIELMQKEGERLTQENDRLKAENQSLKEFAKWYTAGVPESVTEPLPEMDHMFLPLDEEATLKVYANGFATVQFKGAPEIRKTEYYGADLPL